MRGVKNPLIKRASRPMPLTFRFLFFLFFGSISLGAKGLHNFGALIAEPFLDLAAVLYGPLDYRNQFFRNIQAPPPPFLGDSQYPGGMLFPSRAQEAVLSDARLIDFG